MTKLAGKTQGYDKAGNLTLAYSADRASTYKYTYDHNNRLAGVYDSTGTTRKAAFTLDMPISRGECRRAATGGLRPQHVKGSPGIPWAEGPVTIPPRRNRQGRVEFACH